METLGINLGLFDSNGDLITADIFGINPVPSALKVTNQLLDGSWHVQTIGEAAKILEFRVLAEYWMKRIVDEAESVGSQLTVYSHGSIWQGMVDRVDWRQEDGIYYLGYVRLLVTSEE